VEDIMKKEMTLPKPIETYVRAINGGVLTNVTVKIDGTFDRTALPDSLLMDHCFTVADGKLDSLTCRLANG